MFHYILGTSGKWSGSSRGPDSRKSTVGTCIKNVDSKEVQKAKFAKGEYLYVGNA